jgi:hypothetical protein
MRAAGNRHASSRLSQLAGRPASFQHPLFRPRTRGEFPSSREKSTPSGHSLGGSAPSSNGRSPQHECRHSQRNAARSPAGDVRRHRSCPCRLARDCERARLAQRRKRLECVSRRFIVISHDSEASGRPRRRPSRRRGHRTRRNGDLRYRSGWLDRGSTRLLRRTTRRNPRPAASLPRCHRLRAHVLHVGSGSVSRGRRRGRRVPRRFVRRAFA